MEPLERVELAGGPRERGLAHGERFAAEIERNVETYLERFAHHGVDREAVRRQAADYVPLVDDLNPAYGEEMRAVSEGSGVPLRDVALLNVRYEVIYTAWAEETQGETAADDDTRQADLAAASAGTDGCTSFGLLPSATVDGNTYMGQNWDWLAPIADTIFLMDAKRSDAPDFLAMTEAGIVGAKAGVNEHGVGISVNGLISEDDGENPHRKPFHVRCREVLDAERFDEALEPILESDRPGSANFVVGHGDGEVIDVETAPEAFNCVHPEGGVLTHSNHFYDGDITQLGQSGEGSQSTLYRAERLRRALARDAETGDVDVDTVTAGLRDHFSRPASVCSHVDESKPEVEHGQTNASIVVDLTERRLLATRGPPCESEYTEYRLDSSAS
jgi:isopenicillin-N N-acyltransferase-like protein